MNYKRINWIASYPKSGNTWVRCFLEAYFTGSVDINEIMISVQDDVAPAYQLGDGSEITKKPIEIQQLARPMALLRITQKYLNEGLRIPLFIKSHAPNVACNGMELLPVTLTKSCVYLVRDPRDVLPSFAKHMGVDMDIAMKWMDDKYRSLNPSEHRVADYIGDWGSHVDSFLRDKEHNTLIVKYEDLRADPLVNFQKILAHLGITPIKGRVIEAISQVELSKLRDKEEKEGFIESSPHAKDKFFGQGSVGGWRDKLSVKQIHFIERNFGKVMQRLGYFDKKRAA